MHVDYFPSFLFFPHLSPKSRINSVDCITCVSLMLCLLGVDRGARGRVDAILQPEAGNRAQPKGEVGGVARGCSWR